MVFQVVFGLIGISHIFGGPSHISGAAYRHSQSTIAHISGAVFLGGNAPTVKIHVSGSKKMLSVQEPEAIQSQVIRKARSIGITLGSPQKPTSTQVRKKILRKKK